jgi:GrpB-like predicted nucleotidyltransferase (UPF0157 family)/aminoglycoside phosphotransferase
MSKYTFKPYSAIFPSLFRQEKERIAAHLPEDAVIEHIGSTAVPELGGKGIIDIGIAVDKGSMEALSLEIQKLGYEFRPDFSTADRFYYVIFLPDPEEGSRRYHLHLTYSESKEWKELLGFRDYLRNHREAVEEYAAIKKRASLEAVDNKENYQIVKAPWIKKINTTNSINHLIEVYRQKLKLSKAVFTHIDHEDAMVATVFKISEANHPDLILKVCSRKVDYLREVYFLRRFARILPVPSILKLAQPNDPIHGAILMECIEGDLLKAQAVNCSLATEIGSLLARIHQERTVGFGDLTDPAFLNKDPKVYFKMKFEEGLGECQGHLPELLMEKCRHYFERDSHLLGSVDGPCVIHSDFRPGNLIASEGRLKGIIDWSSAHSGFAEKDFYSLEFGQWSKDDNFKKLFLKGYGSIRPVPKYKPLMPFLALNRAVGVVGFTVKRGTWDSRDAKIYQLNRQFLESL